MKKRMMLICVLSIIVSLAACKNSVQGGVTSESKNQVQPESGAHMEPESFDGDTDTEDLTGQTSTVGDKSLPQPDNSEEEKVMMNIQVGEHLLRASLEKNSSTNELLNLLAQGPVTINMRDYSNMEKVGSLPQSLPRNDEPITTTAGDLILYQGNAFVIYYDTNTWDLTRLGRIENITQQELKDILGEKNVTVILSLPSE